MIAWIFPGQGSQTKGMGEGLFEQFTAEVALADEILGYGIERLCLEDPHGLLGRTDHTQPALFVVGALEVMRRRAAGEPEPAYVAGHSLGEYMALFAAGAFDFATGVRLVRERGRLMNEARDGGMLAVLGTDAVALAGILRESRLDEVDVANFNAPAQTVLSGPRKAIEAAAEALRDREVTAIPLDVSAAFHSRLMRPAARSFGRFLEGVRLVAPKIPVIANATAEPYPTGDFEPAVRDLLTRQIDHSVRWVDTVQRLRAEGVEEFVEIGPGTTLSRLVVQISRLPVPPRPEAAPAPAARIVQMPAPLPSTPGRRLGSAAFKRSHGTAYAYMAGAMYRGIASPAMVTGLGRAGFLGILGAGGLKPDDVRRGTREIAATLGPAGPWGVNLLANPYDPDAEMAHVETLLDEGVRLIEASAFLRLSPSVVRFRFTGARRTDDGSVATPNRVIAKVARPEVARPFMGPAPAEMIDALVSAGHLSEEEAWCAAHAPVAEDITVEADSGGHTDQQTALALFPAMLALRERAARETGFDGIRMGAAGGLGTPEAIAAMLLMGADYVVTGSINQATVEAATSETVKDILQGLGIADFAYAPAGDMFELGARVQVVRKGVFFPGRANRLYDLYRLHDGLEDLPADTRRQLEERFFGRSLDEIWSEVSRWLAASRPEIHAQAQANPKVRMAQVFRWYFHHSSRLALDGDPDGRLDYQIHGGPALGAFNAWAEGGRFETWRTRHAAEIARALMDGAAAHLEERLTSLMSGDDDERDGNTAGAVRLHS